MVGPSTVLYTAVVHDRSIDAFAGWHTSRLARNRFRCVSQILKMEVVEQAFVQKLQRDLNCLSDPDRSVRKRAIERLQKRLLNGDPGEGAPSPGVIQVAGRTYLCKWRRLFFAKITVYIFRQFSRNL